MFNSIKPINFKKMSPLKSGILNFLFFFMRLSCKINFPLLSAFIIYLSLRRIKKIKYHPKNKLTLLVLHKEGGIDDLTCAYQNRISKINYLNLHRKFIKIIFHNFFEKKIYDYDYNYYDRDIVLNKKKYFTYLRNVIFYLKKIKKFNGFINFNIFYYIFLTVSPIHFYPTKYIIIYGDCSIFNVPIHVNNFSIWKNNFYKTYPKKIKR